jgi:hypothetical protein
LCLDTPPTKHSKRTEHPTATANDWTNERFAMSSTAPLGLTLIPQESNTGITHATKAIVWQDSLLNMHCQILVWLPSGINSTNFDASVHLKTLTLNFPSAELLYNAQEFEAYYRSFLAKKTEWKI